MNSLEKIFLSEYASVSFMEQQKARVLMYFLFSAIFLILFVLLSSLISMDNAVISGRNFMRVSLLVFCLLSLFLVKNGMYTLASNIVLFSSTSTMCLQMLLGSYTDTADLAMRLYYLYIFIVISAVFCTRTSTVITMLLIMSVFSVIIYRNSSMIGHYTKPLAMGFIVTLLFISILSYLLLSIVKNTFIKIEESDEKEKQHQALARMLKTVNEVSIKLSSLSDELSVENQKLAERTTEQAASIEEIAATIEQTAESVRKNTDSTDLVNRLAVQASEVAEEGVNLVSQVVDSINEINTASTKIGDIISLINEIAFQTNLLALNAAVEAARAGDSGRGFAVVAGEVRNLAQRAASASKDIDSLVKASIKAVGHGTIKVRQSGEVIERISSAIKTVSSTIGEIAEISRDQKFGIDQVNTSVVEINNATQTNSTFVEKNASVSEEISRQAKTLMMLLSEIES